MAGRANASERLTRLTEICLALPKVKREDKGTHAAFLVGQRVLAYYLNNHHGDDIISVCCKALPGENKFLVEAQPDRFYLPAYLGPKGWVGLRLDGGRVDWAEVKELVRASYLQIAPKRFLQLLKR